MVIPNTKIVSYLFYLVIPCNAVIVVKVLKRSERQQIIINIKMVNRPCHLSVDHIDFLLQVTEKEVKATTLNKMPMFIPTVSFSLTFLYSNGVIEKIVHRDRDFHF